jgi:hypothetical protein
MNAADKSSLIDRPPEKSILGSCARYKNDTIVR